MTWGADPGICGSRSAVEARSWPRASCTAIPWNLIAVAEPLNEAVQFSGGLRGDQGGDGFLEAFGQDDGSPLQVGRKPDPLLPHLVEGEHDGHKGDHENEGHDEADRDLHACSPARSSGSSIVPFGALTSGENRSASPLLLLQYYSRTGIA